MDEEDEDNRLVSRFTLWCSSIEFKSGQLEQSIPSLDNDMMTWRNRGYVFVRMEMELDDEKEKN